MIEDIESPRLTNREQSRRPHGGKTEIYCYGCDRNQVRVGERCSVCGIKFYGTQARVRDKKVYES